MAPDTIPVRCLLRMCNPSPDLLFPPELYEISAKVFTPHFLPWLAVFTRAVDF